MPPSERQADARAAFEQWALLQAGCPRDVVSFVEEVERTDEHLGFLATAVEGRRVVWKSAPSTANNRLTFPVVAVETVNAWSVDAASLRQSSNHIALCDSCTGKGSVWCTHCGAAGKRVCGACNGQRKMYGYAANGSHRLLNCKTCRGKGEVDCETCHRGITSCSTCTGGGRVQRWIELERWQRSITNAHPPGLARQLGWSANPPSAVIAHDADIIVDIDRPHSLTIGDLGNVPSQWLTQLAPVLQTGERVAQQRLRIARVSTHTVNYCLGNNVDHVSFTGHRLLPPPANPMSAFAQRASTLGTVRWMLLSILLVIILLSLARGLFYWSVPTLLSLVASASALAATHGAMAEWTAARRQMRRWFIAAVSCALAAIALALAARPRLTHVTALLAENKLEAAERELNALGANVDPRFRADLDLARIRQATDIAVARDALSRIPNTLPQYALAVNTVDRMILDRVGQAAGRRRWDDGAAMLALLSDAARAQPESIASAATIYLPLSQERIIRNDWRGAADMILAARRFNVPQASLDPLCDAIRTAGLDAAAKAKTKNDARVRLRERLDAENILVSWERASGNWGTPASIALRTSMARDVAALEKAARRRAP